MKKTIGFVVFLVLVGASEAEAAILEWLVADGGNGHFYEQVDGEISWTDARDAAATKNYLGAPGYLATSTSAAENQFLTDNFNTFHHWIGGFQFDKLDESAGHWRWVTNEPWIYTNWIPGQEPNESGGPEDFLVFVGDNTPEGQWQDWKVFGDFPRASRFDPPLGYFVEYESQVGQPVVPEPFSIILFGLPMFALTIREMGNGLKGK